MVSEWDGTAWAGEASPIKTLSIDDQIIAVTSRAFGASRPWRVPSIRDALGVPAIQRAVTLISNTTGALTVQAFRNASLMDRTPAIVARPDPFTTPRDFYRDSAYNMASRGECVWWIANVDGDGLASALVNVPLHELRIEENKRNRLLPTYTWGDVVSTRYSTANPGGRFVHVTYLKEPGALRGQGPLQMGKAAVSVSVEAQEWAANFYAGGLGSATIKHASELSAVKDDDGLNEAERLKLQFSRRDSNTPMVVDQNIESIDFNNPNEAGAQMLRSRDWQVGEASRQFGIPGALLEYGVPGASLTYQNLADVWVNFIRGCLAPNYLEPIEQAMTDLLPRSTVARFLTSGLQRADSKTRWEIYQIAVSVLGQEEAAEYARIAEDLAPGNPEVRPVPIAPPSAVPASIPLLSRGGSLRDVRCPSCTRLVGRAEGRAELYCRHCKAPVAA